MSFALLKDYTKRQYISLLHLDAAKGKEKVEGCFPVEQNEQTSPKT